MPQTYTPQECHEFISSITITDILAGQDIKFTVKTDYGGDREFTYTEFKATRQSDKCWSFTNELTETEINFHTIEAAQLRRFIFSYPAEFLDLLILPTVFSEIQTELLSILPGKAAKTWFVFGMQNEKYKWQIISVRLNNLLQLQVIDLLLVIGKQRFYDFNLTFEKQI